MAAKILSEEQWSRLEKTLDRLEKTPPKPRLTITEFLRRHRTKIAQILAKHPDIRPIDIVRAFKEASGIDVSEQTMREVIVGRRGVLKRRSLKTPPEATEAASKSRGIRETASHRKATESDADQ
jgi:hypothetical protein